MNPSLTQLEFARVMFPEDRVTTFEKHEHVKEIEEDKKVSIQ